MLLNLTNIYAAFLDPVVLSLQMDVVPPGGWQLELLLWLQSVRHPVLTFLMGTLTMLGDDLFYVTVLALMYWTGGRDGPQARLSAGTRTRTRTRTRTSAPADGHKTRSISLSTFCRQDAFNLMRLIVLSVLLNVIIKNVIDAPRPFEAVAAIEGLWTFTAGGASFPSGHAQTAATFWLAMAITSVDARRGMGEGSGAVFKTIGMAGLVIFLIALSRLYLGVHWPRDVLAGAAIGGAFGLLGPTFIRRFSRWSLTLTFALSAIGILVFRDHSAVQLTMLLIGATIGHAGSDPSRRGTGRTGQIGADADADSARCLKPKLLIIGILAVAAAYGTTTWLLSALGLPELLVDGLATLETGLMVTWGVPVMLELKR